MPGSHPVRQVPHVCQPRSDQRQACGRYLLSTLVPAPVQCHRAPPLAVTNATFVPAAAPVAIVAVIVPAGNAPVMGEATVEYLPVRVAVISPAVGAPPGAMKA